MGTYTKGMKARIYLERVIKTSLGSCDLRKIFHVMNMPARINENVSAQLFPFIPIVLFFIVGCVQYYHCDNVVCEGSAMYALLLSFSVANHSPDASLE